MNERVSALTSIGPVMLSVLDCPSCGVIFGIAEDYVERRREDHKGFECPNGHSMSFSGPTEAEQRIARVEAEAKRYQAKWLAERDQAEAARREAADAKASEVRLRWRVGHGVCPCCQRSFPGLAAHVATKHPEFARADLDRLSLRMRELLASIKEASDGADSAVVRLDDLPYLNHGTLRALENRGLVDTIGYDRVALTEAGWPLAELAGGMS